MFTPKLSAEQRRQASALRTRLAAALEPVVANDSPQLAPLIAKKAELTGEIAGIERGTGIANLEEAAQLLANRQTQLRLVERQITELNSARQKAQDLAQKELAQKELAQKELAQKELAQKELAEKITALSEEARNLLAEVAGSFQSQHRENLEITIAQYAINHSAQARNLIKLIPWFLAYLKAIRAFRASGIDAATLLEHLAAALENKDFLMVPRS